MLVQNRISTEDEDYYLVKIETEDNYFKKQDDLFKLYWGVPVVIGIITGKRSFIDYFLTPFRNKLTFALSER